MPGEIQRPDFDERAPRRSAWTIVLAGMGAFVLFVGLSFLAGPAGWIVLGAAAILGTLLLIALFHQLVWGRWLGETIRREVEEEEEREKGSK